MYVIHSDVNTFIAYNEKTDVTEFYDKKTNRKLFNNLPASKVLENVSELKTYLESLDGTHVSVAEEGTTIRVFYNSGQWYTATKRKLQAFRSSWADKKTSFGATFAQAVRNEIGDLTDERSDQSFLEKFYENTLSKNKVYFFLLRNTFGERIVCDPPRAAQALLICTQKNYINDFNDQISLQNGVFTHTTPLQPSFEVIQEQLSTMNYRKHQGVIVEKNNNFYKILIPTYAKFSAIRGETPSLRMCYLKLRNPKYYYERALFLENYPSLVQGIEPLETEIYTICCRLHKLYLEKFIHKIHSDLNPVDLRALKVIHHSYFQTRIPTTPQRINDILTAHPVIVNHLLREKKRFEKLIKPGVENSLSDVD